VGDFERASSAKELSKKLNKQIADLKFLKMPYQCMVYSTPHRAIPDGDGLIIELAA